MWIIGCDYHPRFQQIAFLNTEGGECGRRRLEHPAEAEQFYHQLQGQMVRVGMEAGGHARWFERLLAELGHELWVGDPARIRAAETRKQKYDARDADHILELLCNGQFEKLRIRVPTPQEWDVRQLVLHRHRLVGMRTRLKNQLRSVALNEGLGPKPGPRRPEGASPVSRARVVALEPAHRQPGIAGGVAARFLPNRWTRRCRPRPRVGRRWCG